MSESRNPALDYESDDRAIYVRHDGGDWWRVYRDAGLAESARVAAGGGLAGNVLIAIMRGTRDEAIARASDLNDCATRLLIRARGFIERGWCQEVTARDKAGNEVSPRCPDAASWCAFGALIAAGVPETTNAFAGHPAVRRLAAAMDGESFDSFNDRRETVEPVLAAFDRAIAQESAR